MALSTHARRKVWERDHGICARCGADCAFLERMAWKLRSWQDDKNRDGLEAFRILLAAWGLKSQVYSWHVPNLWEADHIVPLAEGGTHDLSNYRTLCVTCHKAETKALAGRLAKARRRQQTLFSEVA